MITVIAILVAGYCALKWLIYQICYLAVLLWIEGKEYTLPSGSEMEACIREVTKRLFGLK